MIEEKTRVPNRYRFTDETGKVYAPFRLKPGVTIPKIIAWAIPEEMRDTDWGIELA